MKYLVMETHPAYAVVLDEEGRFLKAANLRYQVGDTVQDIVEFRQPKYRMSRWPSAAPAGNLASRAARGPSGSERRPSSSCQSGRKAHTRRSASG